MGTRIFGLAGFSGSGKTTLMCTLLPIFHQNGYRMSTLKHAHHNFDIDQEGKDSYRHRQAGAEQVMIASDARWALISEHRDQPSPSLAVLLQQMQGVDIILIEGFKQQLFPKVLIHRQGVNDQAMGKGWGLFQNIVALTSDQPDQMRDFCREKVIALLDLHKPTEIAEYITQNALPLDRFIAENYD